MNGILFVDLDGTIRKGFDELGKFVNGPEDVEIFPEIQPLLNYWKINKGLVIGITNQAGVGLGYMTENLCKIAIGETCKQVSYQIDSVYACFHKPDAGCICRKPMPGLLYKAITSIESPDLPINRHECLMIGDMDSDRECAERAGIEFKWAQDWRANGF